MSRGHPYRYDQGFHDRHRSRFGPQDGRRDIGSPYKRQRRSSSSGNDFTTFSYEDCHQEVGLGNFNDFSAISRDTILERDKRDGKPSSSQSTTTFTVQTSRSNTGNKSTSKISPLSVTITSSGHTPSKQSTPQKSGSLLSSFQHLDHRSPHRSYGSQPTSPYRPASSTSSPQYGPKTKASQSATHNTEYHVTKPNQPATGLLMQANPSHVNTSYAGSAVTTGKEDVYQPKVEAVSPTNSEAETEKTNDETSKEVDNKKRTTELLKQMEKVDKEITDVEKKISDLKEKQKTLEDELSQDPLKVAEEEEKNKENENVKQENGVEEKNDVEVIPPEPKEKTLIERIYEENRRIAAAAHEKFAKIGIPLPTALPLYNQPSDLEFYEENRIKAKAVQLKLVKYFHRKRKAKQMKQRALLEQYRVLQKKWMEKVEKIENNPKRKSKEARIRDSYEKIFPEIKRHREQTERFSRLGSRASWGMSARSDAEYEEILRDLEEKEKHEKHMRQLAVDPPPLLDEDQRRVKYINRNGLIKDLKVYVEQQKKLNVWTEKEKEIFKVKYIEAPKDFEYIAQFLANKNIKDCVLYYYRTKRTGNYKKLAKKQSLKRKRLPNSTGKEETSKSKILKPRTEGDRSESEIEEEEPFDEDSDGSVESSSRIPISTSATQPGKITTPQTGSKAESSVETPRWSKNEREIAIEGLRLYGRNWTAISQMVKTKTEAQCKNFYFNYKRKLDLEHIIAEHNASKIQRQESEETISASEASDDAYEVPEERPSIARSKQNARETRSQAAERRTETTTGPTLRHSRGQRNTRNKSADGKPPRGQTQEPEDIPKTKLQEVEGPVVAERSRINIPGCAGSDEARIIVVDAVESVDKQDHLEVVRSIVGLHERSHGHVSPMESYVRIPVSSTAISVAVSHGVHTTVHSSLQVATPSQAVVKETSTLSDRQQTSNFPLTAETHGPLTINLEHPHTTESLKVAVNPSSTMVYPNVPYRHVSLEKPGRHSEALQNLARNRAAAGNVGPVDTLEEPGDKNEKEKLKKIRFPDPQLPKYEQNEAIGIFNQFSPCIPPDTTSRQQVRTQRLPHPSFHPAGIPMHQFVPHIGPHGPHFPPEMFAIPIPHTPGFDHMYHPQFLEFFHPGMEHNIFSARLREEAARANPGAIMWGPPMDHQGLIFAPHPSFMIPPHMEPVTPTELITRRRESTGHELISPVPSTRCRSVETSAVYSRARTPEQVGIANSKPLSQQRSVSLTDVHSWVKTGSGDRRTPPSRPQAKSLPISKDADPDQVKSYEPFNALMNAAVGARPITSSMEANRVETREQRVRESLKISEAERPQAQFTRQSCVVTNTSVLLVTSSPKDTSRQQAIERHGISSGVARPQPPPLLSITGTHPPRGEDLSSKQLETRAIGLKQSQESPRGLNPREFSPTFSHSPKEQHPPPLVKDTPPIGLRPTPLTTTRDGRVSTQEILPCGCRSTDPCKHQLYSQEVPYVQRIDARSWPDMEQRQSTVGIENMPRNVESTNRGGNTIFRPWTEKIGKESVKSSSPLKAVSPPVQLQAKQIGSLIHTQQPSKRLSGSPLGDVGSPGLPGRGTPSPGGLVVHPYPQQLGVQLSPPLQQHGVFISRPSSEQHGETARKMETHVRSSHPQDDEQLSLPHLLPHERGPRSVLSHAVPHDTASRSSLTPLPQESICLGRLSPQPSSSTPHLLGVGTSSPSVLRPPPQLLGPRSRSPQPQQLTSSSQHNDPSSTSSLRNIHESSIIKSPPLLAPGLPGTPQPSQPVPDSPHYLGNHTRPPFAHHSELLFGASRSSLMDCSMPYSVPHQSSGIPPSRHPLSNQPATQKLTQSSQIASRGTSSDFPSQQLSRTVRPEIMSSENTSPNFNRDSTTYPRPPFESSSEQSRTDSEWSRIGSEQSHSSLEKSRTSSEQFNIFSEQSGPEQARISLEQPDCSRVSPTHVSRDHSSVAVSRYCSPEYDLVKSPLRVDNNELPKSLHRPRLDAPVDIQRHVNPLYTAKMSGKSSESCEVASKSPESSTGNLTNVTITLSSPEEFSATLTKSPERGSFSERPLKSTSMANNLGSKNVDHCLDDETCESREDSRSIAGSSSFGFESPDDEDHELRMRFFPPGDTCDSGDVMYETQDTTSDQQIESDELGREYGDGKQIDGGSEDSTSDVNDVSGKQESDEEFSSTDGTCIPSDSTYIGFSEPSAGETVHNSYRYDSSATQDVVDSTVSEVSEFERPSAIEKRDKDQDEPCKETGNSFAGTRFDGSHSEDDKNHLSLQDETVSGVEGDNDASGDDEIDSSGITMDSTADIGVDLNTVCEVKNAQNSEVDSSGNVEVLDGRIMDIGGEDKIVVDTRGNVDSTESDDGDDTCVVNDDTVMDSVRDISVCEEENRVPGAITGIVMEEDKDAHEESGELRDILVIDARRIREDEGHTVESGDVGQISSRTADMNSNDELVMLAHDETNEDGTADLRDTLDNEPNMSACDTKCLTCDPVDAKNDSEADARDEIIGTENSVDTVSGDEAETIPNDSANTLSMSIWQDSSTAKEVSSSSDRRICEHNYNSDLSDEKGISEANQSHDSQEVNESSSTIDENFADVTDNVDSSTDRVDTQILTAETSSHLDEQSLSINQSVSSEVVLNETPTVDSCTMDVGSSREVHVTSSEEHVTSSNEHVINHNRDVISGEEHVTGRDELVMSCKERVAEGDAHVISSEEHVNCKITEDEHVMAENDVEASDSLTSLDTRDHLIPREDHVNRNQNIEIEEGGEDTIGNDKLKTSITEEAIINSNTSNNSRTSKGDSPGSSGIKGERGISADTSSTLRDSVSSETSPPRPGIINEFLENDELGMEIEDSMENVPDEGGSQQVEAEVSSHGDYKFSGGEVIDSGMEASDASIDNEVVTSAEGSEGSDRSFKDTEDGIDSQPEIDDKRKVSTNTSSTRDYGNIIESTSREVLHTNQDTQEEHSGEKDLINNDITSTVGESQMVVVAQHNDTQISSTFESSTGYQQRGFSPSESESVCRSTSEMFSSCVSTSNSVAIQHDDVATSSDIPNISDISSSDASECAENANEAEARTGSPQIDMPDSVQLEDAGFGDSAHLRNDLQGSFNISRRSSDDYTSNSEEPSTTNFEEHKTTDPENVMDSHVRNDIDLSGNEAESLTKYEDGECGKKGDSDRPSLDNIVDSSTVSPVSFTDDHDITHPWANLGHADTSVDATGYSGTNRDSIADLSTDEDTADTTGYLGINRNNTVNISTTENTVDSTEYLGISRANGGCLSTTTEDAVGTTVGTSCMTSGGKYDITVEAISSDEEELEEGEIAETPGDPEDVTGNVVTSGDVTPCDVTPEHITTSSGSYYPPLDTIPISPPADTDGPSSSSSTFLDFASFAYSSTQLAGSSHASHSVFPYSALNVRSTPNSNCSSPVPVGFGSGCNTPIRFQQADSSNILSGQYEPLSDDESTESHDTDDRRHSPRETDSD